MARSLDPIQDFGPTFDALPTTDLYGGRAVVVGGVPYVYVAGAWAAVPGGPRAVRGLVRGDGGIVRGSGFSVAKPSVGNYTVTFSTSFAAPIIPIIGPYAQPSGGFSNVNATLANEDTWTNNGSSFKVYVTNAGGTQFIDAGFAFYVVAA